MWEWDAGCADSDNKESISIVNSEYYESSFLHNTNTNIQCVYNIIDKICVLSVVWSEWHLLIACMSAE